ncbi:MAG: YfbR-like 5'-deoxynucleotidase [Candidatus Bathyarchaeia archaeon]
MKPEVLDFLLAIRSLMTVGRFSVYKCHFREDVAQHSYYTALYAMVLADLEQKRGTKVDVERLLRMALLHDAEEARTGDIHHPFKHQDAAFAEKLDDRALDWFENLMGSLPPDLAHEYIRLRRSSREISATEVNILKAADKIEALLWAYEEYLLGNVHVRKALIVEDIISKLDQIQLESVKTLLSEIRRRIEEGPVR